MKKLILILTLLLASETIPAQAQQRPMRGRFAGKKFDTTITGKIYDGMKNRPIEYANVILFAQERNRQITGTISNAEGVFELKGIPPLTYSLEIRFMGYKMNRIEDIVLESAASVVDLGIIKLDQTVLNMEDVVVEAEKPALTYEIDKKVVNVSQMQTAISGSAVEVLENVPSITVDIEGNVSLRGSSNFQVLIDGRPTILESNDALQQIPASTIENIEIITNPSAKFDPDGTAGIINIIMKKGNREGRSGLINLNGGRNNKYGGDILFENRTEKATYTLGLDYRNHMYLGDDQSRNETTYQGIKSYIHSDGESERGRNSWGIRGAIDFNLTPKDIVGVNMRYNNRAFDRTSDENFEEWSDREPDHQYYISSNEGGRSGAHYSANLTHQHKFNTDGHELMSQFYYSAGDGDEEHLAELWAENTGSLSSGQKSTESGPSRRMRAKVDYSIPFAGNNKIEAGMQSQFNSSDDDTELFEYDVDEARYIFMPEYSHNTMYQRLTHSIYTMYAGKVSKLGYQAGFRGEYTDRTVELKTDDEKYIIDRWDYFPSFHISYNFTDERQMMASYTRRIDRARGYYLEPFITWMDAYNVRQGNPGLKPEYIDSYEAGFQTFFGKNMVSAEVYYRINQNKVERVRSVYDANVTLHTIENVGKDYSLGTEFMFNVDLHKRWNINLMANIYDYRIEGELYGEPFSRSSYNWSSRFNNMFKMGGSTQLQINGRYHSASVSSQGRREGFFMTDVAVKQELFQRALSVTLQIRDIFGQAKHEFISEGPNFYNHSYFTRESPIIMLNLRYNINHYRPDRDKNRNNIREENGEMEEFDG